MRNYLFCRTLAGINQPLSSWCQLRASVMQKGYFKHCLTPSTPRFSSHLPPSLSPNSCTNHLSVVSFFHHDPALQVMADNESNGTCLLSEERCCLSSDLPSSDMISHSPVLDSKQHLSPPLPPISLCLSLSPNPFPTELPKLPSEDQVGSVILLIINPWLLPMAQG